MSSQKIEEEHEMDELNKGSFVNELVDTIKKTNEDNSINSMNPEVVIQ